MPNPQPLGFYGLQLSEQTEAEITSFNFSELRVLTYEVSFRLISLRTLFCTMFTSENVDDEISKLSTPQLIALLRWLSDRLASLYTEPVQESFDPVFDIHQALEVKS